MVFFRECYRAIVNLNYFLAYPALILFIGTAFFLTFKLRFIQFRGLSHFYTLITQGIPQKKATSKTLNSYYALFSAMAATVGMGNIVGPSMAISIGGPGALFWLLVYIFFGSVTKFTEVSFSVFARKQSQQGDIMGGPAQYLRLVSPRLGVWYAALTVILFTVWSSVQVNTLSCIWAQENIPHWVSGLCAVTVLLAVVLGGVQRIGFVASRIVPLKFLLYVGFALIILLSNISSLYDACALVLSSAFSYQAALSGFAGATIFKAIREGMYKGIFITESGTGTGSIAHALSNVEHPSDQGLLALYSGAADMLLCTLSGLLTIVTGVWSSGKLGNTLIYEAFKQYSPGAGRYVLVVSILLFVVTALIGNTYNGSQSFASLTNYKYVTYYYICAALIAFTGALASVPVVWQVMDIILACVAFPNLVGLIILAYKYPHVLRIGRNR
jgi:AGCS family alanine or glycine:cation symporter